MPNVGDTWDGEQYVGSSGERAAQPLVPNAIVDPYLWGERELERIRFIWRAENVGGLKLGMSGRAPRASKPYRSRSLRRC